LAKSSSNSKKLAKYSPLDYQQQLQKPSGSPVKKKRGRKPKFAPDASAQFANDENKTGLVQQQQQIRLSSNNSSRRTSDTSSNMSAGSEDEAYKRKQGLVEVLAEDSSVLNQEMNKAESKKGEKMRAKKAAGAGKVKRSVKASVDDFATLEQINQMADLDYNQFVDENTSLVAAGAVPEQAGGHAGSAETYLIDRYKYAVRHIRQGLSVEEACNKYRISKGLPDPL